MSKRQRIENEFIKETVAGYLQEKDWRVQENSNVGFSIGGLVLHSSGAIAANYWLNEVYPEHIREAHKNATMHIHDLSMLSPYCAGWSIRQLILEGLGGVPDKITSAPARHLNTLMQQIVNFLGIIQNEWVGAQALSSFDTFTAPFVKKDNLSDKEIRQCMQTFIFGINTPSRWGCVDEATKVLTVNGFKAYNELNEGDMIYTWKDGNLNVMPVKKVIIKKNESGKMHVYSGRNYLQQVTDYHRCLIRKFNSRDTELKTSKEIFGVKTPYSFPAMFDGSLLGGISLTDDEIRLSAMLYTDGCLDYRNGTLHHVKLHKSKRRWKDSGIENVLNNIPVKFTITDAKRGSFGSTMRTISFLGESRSYLENLIGQKSTIHPNFFRMNQRQARLFLKTWALFDGDENKMLLQCDNETIVEQIQHIAVLAGWTSHLVFKKLVSGKETTYVKIKQIRDVKPSNRYEVDYDGIVWCPNTDDGTAVFMKEGNVFISGNSQAPFSNITLDWMCPSDLKDMPAIVGGEYQDFTYGDCQPEMDRVNRIFMEVMLEGDANGRGYQYPIPTYNITKEFDWEHPNCELLFSMTAKYGTPYFCNFVNSDLNPEDIRSMCCFDGSQKVLVRRAKNGVEEVSFSELWDRRYTSKDVNYQVFHNGNFLKGKLTQLPGKTLYKVTTVNKKEILVTDDHINPTDRGDVTTIDLSTDDYLLLSTRASQTFPEVDKGLTYEDGFLIGMYLGDGSMGRGGENNDVEHTVHLSLNEEKYNSSIHIIEKAVSHIDVDANVGLGKPYHNTYPTRINSKRVAGFVREYVDGDHAQDKRLNLNLLMQSEEFRRGIIDGYYATDGGNSNRIYTTSQGLVEDMEALFTSLGVATTIDVSDRTDEPVIIREKEYTRNFPLYCIRWYDSSNKRNYTNLFKTRNNSVYFKIASIEKLNTIPEYVYCFEMEDQGEPYFTLPNGIITHNCRLSLDKRELRKRGGGLFGSDEFTGSIGVVTINLPQLAYSSKYEEDKMLSFENKICEVMELAKESLEIKRNKLNEWFDAGMYPYTKRYLTMKFKNHFNTIGLVGMNEACLNLIGKDLTTEEGHKLAENVLNFMCDKLLQFQQETGNLYNLEATPAESTSYRLAMHDKKNFPDIITSGEDVPYYTNSSQLPVGYTENLVEALDMQEPLQTKYTGGTVFHVMLGEKINNWKSCRNLVKMVCTNYKIPYISISPVYSICTDHGYLSGEQIVCPTCGKDTEVYARIVGYYRAVKNWNKGKREEKKNRVPFNPSV